ncbi:MAG: 3-deoxy-D-manno-octulosonic acid transferase [Bacteroidetes bacterium]|nr:3-deoxy-D-manno-octulosonic acid transferase [Bacteroidota bacterium]
MSFFYSVGIVMYGLLARLSALFNGKASLWVKGRKDQFIRLEEAFGKIRIEKPGKNLAWFHCASLGEFEQGRPLIEAFKLKHPEYLILLTFFSPSGYELRKNYKGADLIFYLPLDTAGNARKFLEIVKPDIVFFIKYEFWFNYLRLLQKNKTPHYLVSAIFRADQHFFKWYGDWPRSILKGFTHIFVQNDYSKELLEFVGIDHVTISGDTRFDRVSEIAAQKKEFPLVRKFTEGIVTIVAGSTWPADEELLVKFMNENPVSCKLIIAPHEIHEEDIIALDGKFGSMAIRYSQAEKSDMSTYRVLIIDSVGMLSQLYRYGQIAYIGGGFGSGIHNTLEAAVYGMPVIFGPVHHKFQEANDLVELKGAFVIHNYSGLEKQLRRFNQDPELLADTSLVCSHYVSSRIGATGRILEGI